MLQASTPPHTLYLDIYPSPVGDVLLVTDPDGNLRALDFEDYGPRMRKLLTRHYGHERTEQGAAPAGIRTALDRYFAGELDAITAIPTACAGTAFQKAVWHALTLIPAGETWSYGQLAARIDNPKAVRAVGLANGANPIGIVVPCHRVIGANGTLTGYGGGMDRKLWLLRHEGAAETLLL